MWYSGKLWRAVLINNDTKTTKLVSQWNISTINYSSGNNTAFAGSYMEEWLNDTSVDGFLGNLRDYEEFIVTDSIWDATLNTTALGSIARLNETITVTAPVGLLNMYEYQTSYYGTTYQDGYLNNELYFWTLTPYSSSNVRLVTSTGNAITNNMSNGYGIRPSINLKASINIVGGSGTKTDPYRLEGDNDRNLNGTKLNTRYSGEYIRFGNDENNLYRIISHETEGLTKITSAEPLKNGGAFITRAFGSNSIFSSTNTIGTFLNTTYLNSSNNYLTNEQVNMIEDSTIWYLGTVGSAASYRLAKYTTATGDTLTTKVAQAKVGLLRTGELLSGQFDDNANNTSYRILTPFDNAYVRAIYQDGRGNGGFGRPTFRIGVRPVMNLKQNIIITSGDGTKENPFTIALE